MGQAKLAQMGQFYVAVYTGAHQAPPARPLGHLARPQLHLRAPQPAHHGTRRRRHLPRRPRARRPGPGGQRVPRGDLRGGLPGRVAGPGRDAPPVPPILHTRRHPQPRQRDHARLDPRGRRVGLCAGPRVRRRFRQPRSDRCRRGRRWRGRDRPTGGLMEGHHLPQPGARRRRAAHPAPQRVQDREPHRAGALERCGGPRAAGGARLRGPLRRGRRPP